MALECCVAREHHRGVLVGNHGEHRLNGALGVSYDLRIPAMDTTSEYHG